ncbi:hypothetical protein B7H23_03370 [Notoacmeibacter marinus]|uniref:Uncharacterized protein n=1 Tax=Notoacmeibacter marinus TaxID=1876515 RepID=A0A231V1A8_9HYPH|nr:hypothetical protein [Notoacmeibacter marinus]OXT01989.1 hypothetical protein B7H23_03370 [Notoacmeibacter marinus]
MAVFEDIQELREWLAPLDYLAFWEAVAPYNLMLPDRGDCDSQIARGLVPTADVLGGLKELARIELTRILGLKHTIPEPLAAYSLRSIH